MARIIRLTESDLTRIVKRVISEQEDENYSDDDKFSENIKIIKRQTKIAGVYRLMKDIFERYGYFIINWDSFGGDGGRNYPMGEIKGGEEVSMEEMVDKDTFKEVSNYYYDETEYKIRDKRGNIIPLTDDNIFGKYGLYERIITSYGGNDYPEWEIQGIEGFDNLYSDNDENPISERYFRKRH